MRLRWWVSVVTLCAVGGLASAGPRLFAAGGGATYDDDEATGQLTVLADPAGAPTATPQLQALATDRHGTVHGLDLGATPDAPVELLTFDHAGRVATSRTMSYLGATVMLAEGLAFGPRGALWVTFHVDGERSFQSGHLGVVDPATGVIAPASVVALSGGTQDDGDMIEFIGDTLYLGDETSSIGTTLFTVDRATGALSTIGEVRDATTWYQLTDLAWDGRHLWGETFAGHGEAGTGRLIRIDPANAAATLVGPAAGRVVLDGITVKHGDDEDDDDDECEDPHHHGRGPSHGLGHRHHCREHHDHGRHGDRD
jgi:hypothetical protein